MLLDRDRGRIGGEGEGTTENGGGGEGGRGEMREGKRGEAA